MKKILFILAIIVIALNVHGVALNSDVFSTTYKNLLWIDNSDYTGITASLQDLCDAQGDTLGIQISNTQILFEEDYKITLRSADIFFYSAGADALTIDGSDNLNLTADTEIDITTAALDINATDDIDIDTSDTTGGVSIATATSYVPISIGNEISETTVNDNLTVAGKLDVTGTTTIANSSIGTTTFTSSVNVGISGSSSDVTIYSDSAGDQMIYDDTTARLTITGIDGSNALAVPDGDVEITDDLTVGGTITGTTGITGDLLGAVDLNGGNLLLSGGQLAKISSADDNTISFYTNNVASLVLGTSALVGATGSAISLGEVGTQFNNLYIDGTAYLDAVDIDDGAVDGATVGANSASTGAFTTLATSSTVTFNEDSADVDFRVETDGDINTLVVLGSSDNVGIGSAAPAAKLHVNDTASGADVEILKLERTNTASAIDDENRVGFYYTEDGDNQAEFARITMVSEVITEGSEEGELKLSVSKAGTVTDIVTVGDTGVLCEGTVVCDNLNYGADDGGDDDYKISFNPAIDAYVEGMVVYLKVTTANTGGCKLEINGIGSGTGVSILTVDGNATADNDILTTGIAHLVYNGTNFILLNPATTCN